MNRPRMEEAHVSIAAVFHDPCMVDLPPLRCAILLSLESSVPLARSRTPSFSLADREEPLFKWSSLDMECDQNL
jgi:hypothetical protein